MNTQLTKNFYLSEFTFSKTAIKHNIDNIPTLAHVERLKRLCTDILQPARDKLGVIKVTSGYRNMQLNQLVGGSSRSDHLLGYAADIMALEVSNLELAKWIKSCCKFHQMILEYGIDVNPSWIHISNNPKLGMQILRKTQTLNYVPWKL